MCSAIEDFLLYLFTYLVSYFSLAADVMSVCVQVLQEIFDMEKNIELIKMCIEEKEAPMKVAQTRLATRTHRPKVEACRDLVQHRYGSHALHSFRP